MAVVNGPITLTGGAGVKPMIKYLLSTDSLAAVTTAGYLNEELLQYNDIKPTDLLLVRYDYVVETGAGTNAFFNVAISNGVITLSEDATTNSVTYTPPSVANHMAVFSNTTGNLTDDVATAINGGNIQAGLSGTAGTVASFPATAAKGSLKLAAVANTGDTVTTISNAAMGQASVLSIPDPFAATANFILSSAALASTQQITAGNFQVSSGNITAGSSGNQGNFVLFPATAASGSTQITCVDNTNLAVGTLRFGQLQGSTTWHLDAPVVVPDMYIACSRVPADDSASIVEFSVTVTAAALALAQPVALILGGGVRRYRIFSLTASIVTGGNFAGGGGDRNLAITDNTTVYSVIPSLELTAQANGQWGDAAVPFPTGGIGIAQSTSAGATLSAQYTGGSTDYATGSIIISGLAVRIA